MSRIRSISRYLLLPLILALPLILVVSSYLTFREFREMKGLYLRNRAATIAARLESLSPAQLSGELFEVLGAEEPALVDLVVFQRGDESPDRPILEAIWSGRELFRTREVNQNGLRLLRAYIPFHAGAEIRIARIDLDASAADFLLSHARHNLVVVGFSGLALVALAFSVFWSLRRTALLERRQLELENLARLGKLSAVLAHEIRNPLGTVKGFVQLAREKGQPPLAQLLDPAIDEIHRLETLVKHLLLYGRPQEPSMRMADWSEIAAELEVHAREAIGDKPIRFSRSGGDWLLRTDPALLRQALLNLIRNAVEALADGTKGEIRLNAAREGPHRFAITLEDNGPGLPEPVRRKLFEPFLTTKSSGTGLGLAISKRLVESLGGSLEFHDAEPHGVRAEIEFPMIDVERITAENKPEWKLSS